MAAIWIVPLLGAIAGLFQLWEVFIAPQISAPQQAAGAAMAAACAIIPYVFARTIEGMVRSQENELKRLNEAMATHTKLLAEMANSSAAGTDESENIAEAAP